MPWLEKQLWLSLAYYHLVLSHLSLRQQLEPFMHPRNDDPRFAATSPGEDEQGAVGVDDCFFLLGIQRREKVHGTHSF